MKIYLYIKTHNITGLKYFGKTTNKDPIKYKGSGKYWKQHIKKHGNNVSTEIYGCFDNEELCTIAALKFSKDHNITNSDLWANLIDENGLDGAPPEHIGHVFTNEQKEKISLTSKRRWENNTYRNMLINIHKQRHLDNPTLNSEAANKAIENQKLNGTYEQIQLRRKLGLKKFLASLNQEEKNLHFASSKIKSEEHKRKISKALTGKNKSAEQVRKTALSKQINKNILIDHNGDQYELHSEFLNKYNLYRKFLFDLNKPIINIEIFKKLGINPEENIGKTKAELGFRFV